MRALDTLRRCGMLTPRRAAMARALREGPPRRLPASLDAVLRSLIVEDHPLGAYEFEHGLPARSAKVLAAHALDVAADLILGLEVETSPADEATDGDIGWALGWVETYGLSRTQAQIAESLRQAGPRGRSFDGLCLDVYGCGERAWPTKTTLRVTVWRTAQALSGSPYSIRAVREFGWVMARRKE